MDNLELKTDIALIKKDISQIEKALTKLDSTLDRISGISKTLAIQERMVENHEKRLNDIDVKISVHNKEEEEFRKNLQQQIYDLTEANRRYIEDLKNINTTEREKRHKEVMESIYAFRKELKEKDKEQDKRLSTLENWRWWIMGIGVAVTTGVTLLWRTFFG
jgi:chromosome segregation ATPase